MCLICNAHIDLVQLWGWGKAFQQHLSTYLEELRESPKADGLECIYSHGEKEAAAVTDRMKNSIPINDNTMVEVFVLCNYLNLDFGYFFWGYSPLVKKNVFDGNY